MNLTTPAGATYTITRTFIDGRHDVIVRYGPVRMRVWAVEESDADTLYAHLAASVVDGSLTLIPQPRWQVALDRLWRMFTFRSMPEEEGVDIMETWLRSSSRR